MAWSLSNTTSDLSLGGLGTWTIEKTPATAAAISTGSVPASGTVTYWFAAASGEPGASGVTGAYTVNFNWTTGSANAGSLAATVYRYDSAGTLQSTGSTVTVSSLAAAVKIFVFSSQNLGTWASGDRLVIKIVVTNSGATSATMSGTPGSDQNRVVRPWDPNLMPLPEAMNLWVLVGGATTTADAIVAPDGTTTADKLDETATTAYHYVSFPVATAPIALTAGTTYTVSAFVQAAERDAILLEIGAGTGSADVWFDFTRYANRLDKNDGDFASTTFTRSVQAFPNGWYRVSYTFSCPRTANYYLTAAISKSSVTNFAGSSYAGTAGSGIYVWGTVFEAASSASTYPGVAPPPAPVAKLLLRSAAAIRASHW